MLLCRSIWAHYNVTSILEPRFLLFGCVACIVSELWVGCIHLMRLYEIV
jgi:hypothetical protein